MPHAGEDEREHEIPGVCTAKWHLVSEEQGVSALSELADYLDVRQSERPKRFGGQGACCGWEGGGHWRGVGKGGQLGGTGLPAIAELRMQTKELSADSLRGCVCEVLTLFAAPFQPPSGGRLRVATGYQVLSKVLKRGLASIATDKIVDTTADELRARATETHPAQRVDGTPARGRKLGCACLWACKHGLVRECVQIYVRMTKRRGQP